MKPTKKKVKTAGDYDLWVLGKVEVKVTYSASRIGTNNTIEGIVAKFIDEILGKAPELGVVGGILPCVLDAEEMTRIDALLGVPG